MRLSERIYRFLLKAYPARYLREYEGPMAQLFCDQLREANTGVKLARLWFRTAVDLLRTVPVHYFERKRAHGVFGLFNKPARRCIFFARYTAEGREHAEITAEDLLMGVLREDRTIRGLLPAAALDEIVREMGGGRPRNRIFRNIPPGPSFQRIVAAARQEAERAGAKEILPRHLMAAIISDGSTLAAQVLLRHGIDRDRL